jgi:hypothetical protein
MMRNSIAAASLPLFMALASADAATTRGTARGASGAPLPGVTVEMTAPGAKTVVALTDAQGHYSVDVPAAAYELTFRLINSAAARRSARPKEETPATVDVALPLEVSAAIVVTGKQTFRNLADLDEPVNGLVGVANKLAARRARPRRPTVRRSRTMPRDRASRARSCDRSVPTHAQTQTEWPHIDPYRFDVLEALCFCSTLAGKAPSGGEIATLGPDGVLLFVVYNDAITRHVFVALIHGVHRIVDVSQDAFSPHGRAR